MCASERNSGNEVVIKTVEIQFDLNVVKVLQEITQQSRGLFRSYINRVRSLVPCIFHVCNNPVT